MLSQFSQTRKAAGTNDECEDDMNELFDDADIEDHEEQEEDDIDIDQKSSNQLEIQEWHMKLKRLISCQRLK